MKDDLISRRAVIEGINNLMESPYANSPQFGKERKEVMEIVKAMCVSNITTAYDFESVIERLQELKTYKLDLADTMSELMNKDKLGKYVCLEDVLEVLNSAVTQTNGNKGD